MSLDLTPDQMDAMRALEAKAQAGETLSDAEYRQYSSLMACDLHRRVAADVDARRLKAALGKMIVELSALAIHRRQAHVALEARVAALEAAATPQAADPGEKAIDPGPIVKPRVRVRAVLREAA